MNKDKDGFGALGLLIVLLVIGLIGGVGWYAWRSIDEISETDTVQKQQVPTNQASSSDFLFLTGFNARIPIIDKTSGLRLGPVGASGYNEADKSVVIIAPQLDSVWKCEADPDSGLKGSIGTISITMQEKRSGPYEPLVTKKLGDYTFGYEQGGSSCTDSPEYQQLVDAFRAQFDKMEFSKP